MASVQDIKIAKALLILCLAYYVIEQVVSGVATPGLTQPFAQTSLHFARSSENVVHTGTHKNTAFYIILL